MNVMHLSDQKLLRHLQSQTKQNDVWYQNQKIERNVNDSNQQSKIL